ncbi:MAG: outer membrane beta-barrel protein [Coxiellaceae bacterium]|nr:outer membrane beta-barrel protein [Coxiellaceae bacterium]
MRRLSQLSLAAILGAATVGAFAHPGPYVGLNYGISKYDTTEAAGNANVYNQLMAGGIYTGYLWGNPSVNYGLELAGNFYGEKKWAVPTIQFGLYSYGVGLSAVLRYYGPKNKPTHFFVEGQGGVNVIIQKTYNQNLLTNPVLPSPLVGQRNTRVRPSLGLGVGYDITSNWQLGVMYSHVFGTQSSAPVLGGGIGSPTTANFNQTASIDSVFARVSYTFV